MRVLRHSLGGHCRSRLRPAAPLNTARAPLALLRARLQVQKEDIELIAAQFDLDKKRAERCLRESKGDVKAALQALLTV
jgi:hypothetical protein